LKLRPKFLFALLPILVGLTLTSYLVVTVICWRQIRQVTLENLSSSQLAFETFERRRDAQAKEVSKLLAAEPSVRALMTTRDPDTIQDGSSFLRLLLGNDLLILCDRDGKVMAVQGAANANRTVAQKWLTKALQTPDERKWWLVDGHLYEIFLQPIYFGVPSNRHVLGLLGLGYEVDDQVAAEIGKIAASQVAFEYGGEIIASSFPRHNANLVQITLPQAGPSDIVIAGAHFLSTAVDLGTSPPVARLVVFKSLDQATQFIHVINKILVVIGILGIFTGTILIVAITHRFTKPLDSLLAGVLALQHQEFDYPLDSSRRNDEFSTLTRAFEQMRSGLLKAQQNLVDSARLATIGRMASSISHDLRHRLTAVLANAEFLASERLTSSRRQELYQEVDGAIRGMTDLLESMVELSRTSESLHVDIVSLRTILTKAVLAAKSHPRFHNIPIDLDCDEEIHGWYDARKLERCFFNVVLNACEAVPKNQGQIEIQVRQADENVYIRVTDNGPGVPAHIHDKLFQPFVSAGKQNGSGLGLAIVQKCCADHRGSVNLEVSSPGRTTFRITLPIGSSKIPSNEENGNPSVLTGAVYGS
jgi:signal transduction histidine kinase